MDKEKAIVLRVYMHCEGCTREVFDCLKYFEGVEEVKIDSANNKVIVKGQKADPLKVLERIRKKYSRNAELLSPIPKPSKKEETKAEKKEEPKVITVVLKMLMYCEGCAQEIKDFVEKIKGILTVEPDMDKSEVIVKGAFDPQKLVETISKRLGKYVEILKQEESKEKEINNDNNKTKEDYEQNVFHYPPQYSVSHIYPNQIFSDENVFSCVVM